MSQSYEAMGPIHEIGPIEQISDSFQKRQVVLMLDQDTDYPQPVPFIFTQAKCDLATGYAIGQQVKIAFNLRGRHWQPNDGRQGRYFGENSAWKLEAVGPAATQPQQPAYPQQPQQQPQYSGPPAGHPQGQSVAQAAIAHVAQQYPPHPPAPPAYPQQPQPPAQHQPLTHDGTQFAQPPAPQPAPPPPLAHKAGRMVYQAQHPAQTQQSEPDDIPF